MMVELQSLPTLPKDRYGRIPREPLKYWLKEYYKYVADYELTRRTPNYFVAPFLRAVGDVEPLSAVSLLAQLAVPPYMELVKDFDFDSDPNVEVLLRKYSYETLNDPPPPEYKLEIPNWPKYPRSRLKPARQRLYLPVGSQLVTMQEGEFPELLVDKEAPDSGQGQEQPATQAQPATQVIVTASSVFSQPLNPITLNGVRTTGAGPQNQPQGQDRPQQSQQSNFWLIAFLIIAGGVLLYKQGKLKFVDDLLKKLKKGK